MRQEKVQLGPTATVASSRPPSDVTSPAPVPEAIATPFAPAPVPEAMAIPFARHGQDPLSTHLQAPRCPIALSRGLRVGGMAFGNGVLMRSEHFWAWARDDGSLLAGPVRTHGERHRLLRLPLVRSALALVEMAAFAVARHRQNDRRLNLRLLLWIGVYAAAGFAASRLLPAFGGRWFGDLLFQVVGVFLGLLVLWQAMGGAVWRYHGAEHKAVNAYEGGADLNDLREVMLFSRIHSRCGTNLVVIVLVFMLAYLPLQNLAMAGLVAALYAIAAIAVSLELFRALTRRPDRPVARAVLFGGRVMQRALTTREPSYGQLALACRALREVVGLESSGTTN